VPDQPPPRRRFRLLRWSVFGLALVLFLTIIVVLFRPRDPITQANWQNIRTGMTEKEVQDILGRPGMDVKQYEHQLWALGKLEYDDVPLREPERRLEFAAGDEVTEYKCWIGRRGCITVTLDHTGRVQSKSFAGFRIADPNLLERLRYWLGW
jgi:hypothetical protein